MTIDEAIAHAKEKAEKNKEAEAMFLRDDLIWNAKQEHKLAEEHEQLAEWLEELKVYKECNISKTNFSMGYNKAIDDCLYMVQSIKDKHNEDKSYPINYGTICGLIIELQDLKAGGIDGNERTNA